METWPVMSEEQARYWNGDEAAHWLVHEERYERMLAPFGAMFFADPAAAFANIAHPPTN
jgi:hypothetical protein